MVRTPPDGSSAPHTIFQFYFTTDDQQMLIAAIHMEGKALQWFQRASNNAQFCTWLEFARAVEIRFGPSEFDDP